MFSSPVHTFLLKTTWCLYVVYTHVSPFPLHHSMWNVCGTVYNIRVTFHAIFNSHLFSFSLHSDFFILIAGLLIHLVLDAHSFIWFWLLAVQLQITLLWAAKMVLPLQQLSLTVKWYNEIHSLKQVRYDSQMEFSDLVSYVAVQY